MAETTSVIHSGTDELGNTIFYVMEKSSPSKSDSLNTNDAVTNILISPTADEIHQPVNQYSVASSIIQNLPTPSVTYSSLQQYSVSSLPQNSTVSIMSPETPVSVTAQYTKTLLPPLSVLQQRAGMVRTDDDVTSNMVSLLPTTSMQQVTRLDALQNGMIAVTPMDQTARVSNMPDMPMFNHSSNVDSAQVCQQSSNTLQQFPVSTLAQSGVKSLSKQNSETGLQEVTSPQVINQKPTSGNNTVLLQHDGIDFSLTGNTYTQEVGQNITHNNDQQTVYSLVTPGIPQSMADMPHSLIQSTSVGSLTNSQINQISNPGTNLMIVPSTCGDPSNSLLAKSSEKCGTEPVTDENHTTICVDSSQILNGLESFHSLLEAVGVDGTTESEVDMTTDVEKFHQRLKESQNKDQMLNGSSPNVNTLQTRKLTPDIQTGTNNLVTTQANQICKPAADVSQNLCVNRKISNDTLSKILVDLHIKPVEKLPTEVTKTVVKNVTPESIIPNLEVSPTNKLVSDYGMDFSNYPNICGCYASEKGSEIPVEQIWLNKKQMYYLPQIAIVVISSQEYVGFLKQGQWYISVAEVTQRLLPWLRQEVEKYLIEIGKICKKEYLSLEEIEYLKQRKCINMHTKSCTVITLESLREMCRRLKLVTKPIFKDVLDCVAGGNFYRKVFEKHTRCSRCGGGIKMLDIPDRYILLDSPSMKLSEEGHKSIQKLYTRKCEDQKGVEKTMYVGKVYAANSTVNGFKLDEKVYVSLKELVSSSVFRLETLQEKLQVLQYRPRPAPSSVNLHFLNENIDLNDTLWIDMTVVRCICCMLKDSSVSPKVNLFIQRIARGQYFTNFSTELLAVDDTSSNDIVYTLDPVTLKVITKHKESISLCAPRKYVKQNCAIPKLYRGWNRLGSNLHQTGGEVVKPSDSDCNKNIKDLKLPPEDLSSKNLTATDSNLKPGIYFIENKNDLVKFLNTNVKLSSETNAISDENRNFQDADEKHDQLSDDDKPTLNIYNDRKETYAKDTMDIKPIRYQKRQKTVGPDEKKCNIQKGSDLKGNKSKRKPCTSPSSKIQEEKNVSKRRSERQRKKEADMNEEKTNKMAPIKNLQSELEEAVEALENDCSWNRDSLVGTAGPTGNKNLTDLVNDLEENEQISSFFQDRTVIVEPQPSQTCFMLTGDHIIDHKLQEFDSRDDSPMPLIGESDWSLNSLTTIQHETQKPTTLLKMSHSACDGNNFTNSPVKLQSTPCKTSLSTASKTPLLSPVVWTSPKKLSNHISGFETETGIDYAINSPCKNTVFKNVNLQEACELSKSEMFDGDNCGSTHTVSSLHQLNVDASIQKSEIGKRSDHPSNELIDERLGQSSCMLTPNSPRLYTSLIYSSPEKQNGKQRTAEMDNSLSRLTQLYSKCASFDETQSSDQSLHVLAAVAEAFTEEPLLNDEKPQQTLPPPPCKSSSVNIEDISKLTRQELKVHVLHYLRACLQHIELNGYMCKQDMVRLQLKFKDTAWTKLPGLMADDGEEKKKRFLTSLSKLIVLKRLISRKLEAAASLSKEQDVSSKECHMSHSSSKQSQNRKCLKQCGKKKKMSEEPSVKNSRDESDPPKVSRSSVRKLAEKTSKLADIVSSPKKGKSLKAAVVSVKTANSRKSGHNSSAADLLHTENNSSSIKKKYTSKSPKFTAKNPTSKSPKLSSKSQKSSSKNQEQGGNNSVKLGAKGSVLRKENSVASASKTKARHGSRCRKQTEEGLNSSSEVGKAKQAMREQQPSGKRKVNTPTPDASLTKRKRTN